MRLGRMNNPAGDLASEIALTKQLGFDYLELTLEPPKAAAADLKASQVAAWLGDAGLGAAGHTAFYLPVGHPFEGVRLAAVDQLRRDLDFMAEMGIPFATVHPDGHTFVGLYEQDRLKLQADSFARLCAHGDDIGVQVLCENLKGFAGDPDLLKQYLFDPLPTLGLNLDVAHAALGVQGNRTARFLELLGDRLVHVHVSDNNGEQDLHQPVGTVRLPLQNLLKKVRATGYDAGITLEVFANDPRYVALSREIVAEWWAA
jgi:sugar phosphate isomerase/epimerase